jgi:hypothetical protein
VAGTQSVDALRKCGGNIPPCAAIASSLLRTPSDPGGDVEEAARVVEVLVVTGAGLGAGEAGGDQEERNGEGGGKQAGRHGRFSFVHADWRHVRPVLELAQVKIVPIRSTMVPCVIRTRAGGPNGPVRSRLPSRMEKRTDAPWPRANLARA